MSYKRVDHVRVTTLVENSVNLFMGEREGVQYRGSERGTFMAEHGWAALIETTTDGEQHAILLDAGLSDTVLLHNMVCLKINPASVEALVVSHGHGDHTGSVAEVAWRAGKPLPIYVHPTAFRERWYIPPDGPRRGPWRQEHEAWESAGGEIVPTEEPTEVFPGCIVTGGVPRITEFEQPPKHLYYRDDDTFHADVLTDDQSVAILVKDKGLVVVSGCAHAGIVNTVRYAKEFTGEDRVWAVAGGFHLGRASAECIEATIAGLKAVQPTTVAPGHCTGFDALRAFATAMPDQFALNVVGTVIDTEEKEGEEA